MTGLHEFAATLPGMLLLLGYTAPVLFGFFCAWWAQEHDRNPWLWFFFGALLSPIAGLTLLGLNGKVDSRPAGEDLGHLVSVRKDVV
jgi:hypothetical protein